MNAQEISSGPPTDFPVPPAIPASVPSDGRKVGMIAFLASEASFFSTLITAYVVYWGDSMTGPTPAQALSLPLVLGTTVCLLASSFTIHLAEMALRAGYRARFQSWWTATILLGIVFLAGTGYEWYDLIVHHHLTIGRNLFGTTYFTLVGFHAAHVSVGVVLMVLMLALYRQGQLQGPHPIGMELVSWYWHFVDAVWVVVFAVVYLLGR